MSTHSDRNRKRQRLRARLVGRIGYNFSVTGWRRLFNPYNISNTLVAVSVIPPFFIATVFLLLRVPRWPASVLPSCLSLSASRFPCRPLLASWFHPRRAFAPGNTFPCIFLGGFSWSFARPCPVFTLSPFLSLVHRLSLPLGLPRALITNFSVFPRNSRSLHHLFRVDSGFFRTLLYTLFFFSGRSLAVPWATSVLAFDECT